MQSLSAYIPQAMQHHGVKGISLAVIKNNIISHEAIFGTTKHGQPLTPDVQFQAASLSKPVFATLVMKLVEDGQIDLDRPLASYLPSSVDADPRTSLITARHVLTHTTGLPNWCEGTSFEFVAHPGDRFGYSGEGFEYLKRVMEHITQQPLHDYARNTLFRPLGMSHSTFAWAVDAEGNLLLDSDGEVMPGGERSISGAAYSLWTTAHDYALFLKSMLAPNDPHSATLSSSSIETMLTPQVQVGKYSDLFWGPGWGVQRTAIGDLFWHWGGAQNEYANFAVFSQAQNTGLVVLTNNPQGIEICRGVVQHVFGGDAHYPAFDWIAPLDAWRPDAL